MTERDTLQQLQDVLATRVRQCMRQLGLTQARLAILADCDERTIRRLVGGQGASLATIEKVATALHVEAVSLLTKAA